MFEVVFTDYYIDKNDNDNYYHLQVKTLCYSLFRLKNNLRR